MAKNENRCWPGYEPVKGKEQHEQGSCRPKAESKMTAKQKEFRGKRAKQIEEWKEAHPGSPSKAAQHLRKPGTKSKPVKKASAKKTVTRKKPAAKKSAA